MKMQRRFWVSSVGSNFNLIPNPSITGYHPASGLAEELSRSVEEELRLSSGTIPVQLAGFPDLIVERESPWKTLHIIEVKNNSSTQSGHQRYPYGRYTFFATEDEGKSFPEKATIQSHKHFYPLAARTSNRGGYSTAFNVEPRGGRESAYVRFPSPPTRYTLEGWYSLPSYFLHLNNDYISADFLHYLDVLSDTSGFTDGAVAKNVKSLLWKLSSELGILTTPNPQALPGEDEGSLELSWWIGKHQISVDVFPNGNIDWFWRNSETYEYEGEEGKALNSPLEKFIQHFREAVASG